MATPQHRPPLRLFLDTGVLIDGFFNRWGTCKAVLILATLRTQRDQDEYGITCAPAIEEAVKKHSCVQEQTQGWSL